MSRDLARVRHTPCSKLTDLEHYYLELHKYMTDIRLEANRLRMSSWMTAAHSNLRYLIGRLHGYGFGMSSLLGHRQGFCGESWEVFEAYMAEADFLAESYQGDRA